MAMIIYSDSEYMYTKTMSVRNNGNCLRLKEIYNGEFYVWAKTPGKLLRKI